MLTMIIADDEAIERKALNLMIQKNFPEVQIVAMVNNGIELVAEAKRHNPDIAIVDITMPGMDGLEAIEILRERKVKTRFIINTAYSEFEFAQKALSLKAEAYILKAQKQKTTIETIKSVCALVQKAHENIENQKQAYATLSQVGPMLESQIMYSIFLDAPNADDFKIYAELHSLSFEYGTIVSIIPIGRTNQKFNKSDQVLFQKII